MAIPPDPASPPPGKFPIVLAPTEQSAPSPALLLPNELIVGFMRYLNPKELLTAGQACKHFQMIASDKGLWKLLFESRFGRCDHLESHDYLKAYRDQYRVHLNFTNRVYVSRTLLGQRHLPTPCSLILAPDGCQLIAGTRKGMIKILDFATGTYLNALEGHIGPVKCLVLSLDGTQLISGSEDAKIRIWDLTTHKCLKILEGHTGPVKCLVLSFDGTQLISGSEDAKIRIWDLATGACVNTLEGHTDRVSSLVSSPDGRQLISGSSDTMIKIWDLATCRCLNTFEGHKDTVKSLVISPDGKQLISASWDTTIKIWDLATGRCLNTLEGHIGPVFSFVLSLDGKLLISGSYDCTIRIWDLTAGTCLNIFEEHTDSVYSLVLGPSGRQLVSGSDDRTIRIWDFGAAYNAVFKQIADLFKQGTAEAAKEAMDRFNRMPKTERNIVYAELYEILKPWGNDYWGCAEHAFHDQHGQASPFAQKAQAIENHLARSS